MLNAWKINNGIATRTTWGCLNTAKETFQVNGGSSTHFALKMASNIANSDKKTKYHDAVYKSFMKRRPDIHRNQVRLLRSLKQKGILMNFDENKPFALFHRKTKANVAHFVLSSIRFSDWLFNQANIKIFETLLERYCGGTDYFKAYCMMHYLSKDIFGNWHVDTMTDESFLDFESRHYSETSYRNLCISSLWKPIWDKWQGKDTVISKSVLRQFKLKDVVGFTREARKYQFPLGDTPDPQVVSDNLDSIFKACDKWAKRYKATS